MKKVIIAILIVIIIIASLGYGGYCLFKSKFDTVSELENISMESSLNSYVVKRDSVTTYVRGTGEIQSFNVQDISIENYEKITEQYVSDGEEVSAKERLMKVSGAGTARYITSPIDGLFFEIDNSQSSYGNQSTATTKSYKVYDLDEVGVLMTVSEADVVNIEEGQKAIIKITALNREVEGTVSYISKLPSNGRFNVKISMDYSDDIRFGYGTSVKIITKEVENMIVIPYDALQMDEAGRYFVVTEDFKQDVLNSYWEAIPEEAKTYVEVGTVSSTQAEIISGLEEGQKIIYRKW